MKEAERKDPSTLMGFFINHLLDNFIIKGIIFVGSRIVFIFLGNMEKGELWRCAEEYVRNILYVA